MSKRSPKGIFFLLRDSRAMSRVRALQIEREENVLTLMIDESLARVQEAAAADGREGGPKYQAQFFMLHTACAPQYARVCGTDNTFCPALVLRLLPPSLRYSSYWVLCRPRTRHDLSFLPQSVRSRLCRSFSLVRTQTRWL